MNIKLKMSYDQIQLNYNQKYFSRIFNKQMLFKYILF